MSRSEQLGIDLVAEHEALDSVVAEIGDDGWEAPTPAEGWAVRDQISHLAFFDRTAALALREPDAFRAHRAELFAGGDASVDLAEGRSVPPAELLAGWRGGRGDLERAIGSADPTARVPWYGPDMSLASFVTARLMETWAHGQDVRDALHVPPSVSDRLRHVCFIGYSARRYAFLVHGVDDPETPVRMKARAPDGSVWNFGPDDATEEITGSALAIALVFTQRRHRDDTDVVATGATAEQWLGIAQAFAGPAGPGRPTGLGLPDMAS